MAPGWRSIGLFLLATSVQTTSTLVAQSSGPPIAAHPGDKALTVEWSEPANVRGITAYDVRYIQSAADETVDANWTLIEDAWTSGGLYRVVTGLTNDTEYDVQVRAVTTSGDGTWSATVERVRPSDSPGVMHGEDVRGLDLGVLAGPGTPIAGVLDDATDNETFAFAISRLMMVRIRIPGIPGSTPTLYHVIGGVSAGVYRYNSSFTPPPVDPSAEFLIEEALGPGTYAIGITPPASLTSATAYEIHWDPEPQDKDNALSLGLDSSIEGSIGEYGKHWNWFKIDVAAETDVLIWSWPGLLRYFGSSQALGNLNGELYDSTGRRVAVGTAPANTTETHFVIRKRLSAGLYHLRVESPVPLDPLFGPAIFQDEAYSGAYTIFADVVTDAGGTIATATPIQFQTREEDPALSPVGGRIDGDADVNYYHVNLTANRFLLVAVASADLDLFDLDVSLVNSSGQPVTMFEYRRNYPNSGVNAGVNAIWLVNRLDAGDYYVRVASRRSAGAYWIMTRGSLEQDHLHSSCSVDEMIAADDLYSCQWHLPAIRARETWTTHGVMGTGITVAIVDDGLDEYHMDLRQNVDLEAGRDYSGQNLLKLVGPHGTQVAGLVAARDNDFGVRGVAPRATIYGRNFIVGPGTDADLVDAMLDRAATTAITNNSWGFQGPVEAIAVPVAWKRAVTQGLRTGWNGKGTVYVFAVGNAHEEGQTSNLSELTTHVGVVAVCGTGPDGRRVFYSETGQTLWVCAPTAGDDTSGIWTTAQPSRYTGFFNGTSASSPIVAGVVALIREANPKLTWRDVKLILAGSAAKNDASHADWRTAGNKYEDGSSSYNYNNEYGFGLVDAKAAVELAESWQLLPQFVETRPVRVSANVPVEDATPTIPGKLVQSEITIDDEVEFIEFVQIDVEMETSNFRDLDVELISPDGKVSKLSNARDRPLSFLDLLIPGEDADFPSPYSFGSARYLGLRPEGVWKLKLRDVVPPDQNDDPLSSSEAVLKSWSLKFFGHRKTPGAPDVLLWPEPGKLTVSWGKPRVIGASAVTGYRLRWATQTDAEAGVWTTVNDAGSGGSLREVLENLVDGRGYVVQVAGINAQGRGRWSRLAVGVPGLPPPDPEPEPDPEPPLLTAALAVPSSVQATVPATFDGSGSVGAESFSWDFGDGTVISHPSTQAMPSHAYVEPGSYTVRLEVAAGGDCGQALCRFDSATATVEVAPPPLAAVLVVPASVQATLRATFDGSGSVGAESYSWDFGDGTVIAHPSTQATPAHVYAEPGSYTVRLEVAAGGDCGQALCRFDSATATVEVAPPPLAAVLVVPASVQATLRATFDGSGSVGAESYSWDFGDGTVIAHPSTQATPAHVYAEPGSYTVRLEVAAGGDCGQALCRFDSATATVEVAPPPLAAALATPSSVEMGVSAIFDGSGSVGAESYRWNFGDGMEIAHPSTEATPSHTYVEPGSYMVRLEVAAGGDCGEALCQFVSVTARVEVSPPPLTANLSGPSSIETGVPATFDGSGSVGAESFRWDFGDGTVIAHPSTEAAPSHTYVEPGSYTVRLEVAAGDCGSDYCSYDVATAMVTVEAGALPAARFDLEADCGDDLCIVQTGVAVALRDWSSGTVATWHWDFGDGESSSERSPVHSWSTPGFYRVTLTVSGLGESSTVSRDILVRASEPAGTCEPDAEALCLADSRYQVSVEWWTADGRSGAAKVAHAGTNDSGLFWFFDRESWEILVKLLDGCAANGHVWLYSASTTDLGYVIRVSDTVTGTVKEYRNEPGTPAAATTDATAFTDGCRP